MSLLRIIDANINRVAEGLRVLEDIARFIYSDKELAKEIRGIRHLVRESLSLPDLITSRDAEGDIGLNISQSSDNLRKEKMDSILMANIKRAQEGLRSIEESLKVLGYSKEAKIYEALRFRTYSLEKKLLSRKKLPETDVYAILGEEFSRGKSNFQIVEELARAGVKIVQYREKNKGKAEKLKECLELKRLTAEKKMLFIVNDDIDIAMAVKADGIHLGQEDIPVMNAKKIVPAMIIGVSTHNPKQALAAVEEGADYIGVGPVFETATKEKVEKSEGLKYLQWVAKNIEIPFVAIGGIKENNIAEVQKCGARYFAMISELTGAEDITGKVEKIRKILKG